MVGKTKAPTKADKRRFLALQDYGCVCCRIEGDGHRDPDIHHIVEGGRRLGHQYTLGLCPYHHRGIQPDSFIYHGPSLADGKRPFIKRYGTERFLLEYVNGQLELEGLI